MYNVPKLFTVPVPYRHYIKSLYAEYNTIMQGPGLWFVYIESDCIDIFKKRFDL